jgi:putative hydrolase of the HAD superfamily
MTLVFDLDDTLYNEVDFVLGGFRAVSKYLAKSYKVSEKSSYLFMKSRIDRRGDIFDELLKKYNIYTSREVKKCIKIYRNHKPKISLTREAIKCLKRFEDFPIYIVTDGHKVVQRRKIKALGLDRYVIKSYPTNAYGKDKAKPNPHCFMLIVNREKTLPAKVVYIADNPKKDFVGIKPLGFKTIRLLRGPYKELRVSAEYDADLSISSLNQLTTSKIVSLMD